MSCAQLPTPHQVQVIASYQVQSPSLTLDDVLALIPNIFNGRHLPSMDELESALAAKGVFLPHGDTKMFAEVNHVKPQSVRKRHSQTGSYFGIRPRKLANRRQDWILIRVTPGLIAANDSNINDVSKEG